MKPSLFDLTIQYNRTWQVFKPMGQQCADHAQSLRPLLSRLHYFLYLLLLLLSILVLVVVLSQ